MREILPETVISEARENRDRAFKLTNRWNHALKSLLGLKRAFKVEFDPKTYPEALRPGSKTRKPRGYFEKLLAATITIHPPAPIPKLIATKAKPQTKQPKSKPANRSQITSSQIRNARQAKGWSQAKLAGLLGVSQRYISMFERGQRFPNSKQQSKLQKILEIE